MQKTSATLPKRESAPHGSRRGGRDDVGGLFGFTIQTATYAQTQLPDLAARRARVLQIRSPKKERAQSDPKRDAGKTGCALHPRSHVPMHMQKNAHEHTGSAEAVRPSLRNGFTAYIVLSPARPGLFVTVVARIPPRNLTPATGASGPHDFAVRFTRHSSKAHPRPPLPAPTSVTMANAPSLGTGWRRLSS
jgi:hypothetical protein